MLWTDRYLPGGDLLNYCNRRGLPLPPDDINVITRHLIRALVYLHNNNVIHADVKLENCLFASDSIDSLHLVDFGLSMNTRNISEIISGIRGTLNYRAPEILTADQNKPMLPQIGDRADVWAAGVVLFTLSVGFLPFNG